QPVGLDVPEGEVVAAARLIGAHLLLGYDVDVARVPDLDAGVLVIVVRGAGGRGVGLLARRSLHRPVLHAKEDTAPVLGPAERTVLDDALFGQRSGELVGLEGVSLGAPARRVAPGDDRVALAVARGVAYDPEIGEVVGGIAPDERAEPGRVGLERAQRAGRRVVDLHAVAELVLRVDDHGQDAAVVAPGELGDVAE